MTRFFAANQLVHGDRKLWWARCGKSLLQELRGTVCMMMHVDGTEAMDSRFFPGVVGSLDFGRRFVEDSMESWSNFLSLGALRPQKPGKTTPMKHDASNGQPISISGFPAADVFVHQNKCVSLLCLPTRISMTSRRVQTVLLFVSQWHDPFDDCFGP